MVRNRILVRGCTSRRREGPHHLMLRETREQLSQQLVAINNEMEMARQIQLSILPHEIPTVPGLEITARYVPMSSVA